MFCSLQYQAFPSPRLRPPKKREGGSGNRRMITGYQFMVGVSSVHHTCGFRFLRLKMCWSFIFQCRFKMVVFQRLVDGELVAVDEATAPWSGA